MRTTAWVCATVMALGLAAVQAAVRGQGGQAQDAGAVAVDADDIGGVVSGPKGPEAGVWVIAETTEPPHEIRPHRRHRRSRPVSGAGSAEAPRMTSGCAATAWSIRPRSSPARARQLNLTATIAPDPHAAAQYYPSGYWFSLIKVPDKCEFPGTGPEGNGISPNVKNQAEWLRTMKSGTCWSCHALGTKATREMPEAFRDMKTLEGVAAAGGHRARPGRT